VYFLLADVCQIKTVAFKTLQKYYYRKKDYHKTYQQQKRQNQDDFAFLLF